MQLKRSNRKRRQQDGYVLLAILFALTVLIVGLAVAVARTTTALQRTKEGELIRRGEQYALAIRRFYKKFGRYPSSIDQLENTNNIRFLRRRYLDPLTGKDDWAAIQYGQARPALGFFGQKITTVGGASPSGPGLGPSKIGTGLGGTSSQFSIDSSPGNTTSLTSTSSTGTGSSGTSTTGTSGSSTGLNSGPGPSGGAGNPLSSDQLSGKTFGGGAIVGVSVPSQKQSLKEFQQKDHYNDWQFVYDPTVDPTLRGGLGVGSANGVPGTNGSTFGPGGLNPGGLNPGGLNPTSPTTNPTTSGTGGTTPSNPH